jgi:sec-independent protein translocase protein TatB
MFNVGGGELLVIFLVALIVLGPEKLPETARKIGNVMGELRRMSQGFQNEMRGALDDVTKAEPPATTETPPQHTPTSKLEPVAEPAPEPEEPTKAEPTSDDSAA